MKITTNRAELADALAWVSQAISKNPPSVMLSGLKIVATGDRVAISAFDCEVSHEALVRAEVASEGECIVPAGFIRSIVAKMRGAEVELVFDAEQLTIRSGRSSYAARTFPSADYPTLPESPPKVGTVDAGDLLAGLAAVMHPIDDASPHEQVRGLRIEAADELELIGMDRFRIATAALRWEGSTVDATVPSKSFHAAAKGMNGTVTLGANEGAVGLSDEHRRVTIRALSPGYTPLWRRMLEVDPKAATAVLDVSDLADAVKRAGSLAGEGIWINVAFKGDELLVDIDALEDGAGTDVLEAEIVGEATGLLSPNFLAAALAAVPSGQIRLSRTGNNKPWQIHPLDHPHIRLAVMGKAKS